MFRETQVIILATGAGTGLRPLSNERPKILAPVCNATLFRRLLGQLQVAGIQNANVVIRPASQQIHKLFTTEAPVAFRISVSIVPEDIDGTVPVVRHVWDSSSSSALVIYGDSLLSMDFRALLDFHYGTRKQGSLATILFHQPADLRSPRTDGKSYHGVLSVNREGQVTRFIEKPSVAEIHPGFDLASAAVFVCEKSLFKHPHLRNAKDFSTDVFERIATENSLLLYGCSIGSGFRSDVGTISRFFDANMRVLRRELAVPIPGREVSPGVWVGRNTHCDQAHLIPPTCLGSEVSIGKGTQIGPGAVIGDACQISEGASVRDSILLEHCQVNAHAEIESSILGPHCRVANGVKVHNDSVLGAYTIVGAADCISVGGQRRQP